MEFLSAGAQVLMAVATLVLAAFTYRSVQQARKSSSATVELAKAAEKEVAAAHRQNELAERTLLASMQPVLSDLPRRISTQLDEVVVIHSVMDQIRSGNRQITERSDLPDDWVPWIDYDEERKARAQSMHIWANAMLHQAPQGETAWGITTLFRNVGNGVAIVELAILELGGEIPEHQIHVSKSLIPQGDYTRITFNIAERHFPDPLKSGEVGWNHANQDFFIDIVYVNAAGTGRLRTRQRIQFIRGTPYIAGVEIYDHDSGKRLAATDHSGRSTLTMDESSPDS
jgi:hypothetical protein